MLSRIYRFVRLKIQKNRLQTTQTDETKQKAGTPTKPPTKKVLITYGIFSLLFIALASAAWFFKRAEFLPEYSLFQTNKLNEPADVNTQPDGAKAVVRKKPEDNKATVNNPLNPASVDKLNKKVGQLKGEIRQLNAELDTIKIQQYLTSARYLIDTRTSPKRALAILQATRSYIESRSETLDADTIILLPNIENQIVELQRYIAHSPNQTLTMLTPLIEHLYTQLETAPNRQSGANTNNSRMDDGWLAKIYDMGKTLIKVEQPNYRYAENNRLLLKLLIAARSAALLSEPEQFNIALEDALRIIDTMPQPPISREQIESILSLKVIWQLPNTLQ